ncbi:bifunctional metallophosphatase/5'-nucleotidase [Photobacterium lipolyticum]|uniref:Bifunctional metallophosphatase/5'-nucleotidase n=1 Tax=Photobacterium lipolyticum TaxID=266810 RepID=A0A2T3N2F9_9GAMM|nr:5'-nucleotidase C-terminal domain-containing protein [Photobacterium lipolyticum]PSW06521.1 bifunctional metallophosphatase/5'-nucleotidase [Photobacterium lipolyticum]
MKIYKRNLVCLAIAVALTGCNSDDNNTTTSNNAPNKNTTTTTSVKQGLTLINTPEVVIKGENSELTEQSIVIGATSDLHGRVFGYDYALGTEDSDAGLTRISTLLKKERENHPNMILIDIGDTVQGNSAQLFNDQPSHPMIDTLNSLNYDLWVPGNHEFNFDRSFIDRNLENFDGAVISSSIKWASNGNNYLRSYQIYNVNGCKVAIIGLTPSYVPNWEASAPEHFAGLNFEEELKAATAAVEEVTAAHNPDIVVGALHLGRTDGGMGVYGIASALADKFDVIMAGHEHATYIEEVTMGKAEGKDISKNSHSDEDKALSGVFDETATATKVKIIEPGKWGSALAKTEIKVKKDADGKWVLVDTTLSNISTKNVEEDADLAAKYQYVDDKAKADAEEIIGTISGNFTPTSTGGADEIVEEDFFEDADTTVRLYSTIHAAKVQDSPLMDLIQYIQLDHSGATIAAASLFSDTSNLRDGQDFAKKDATNLYKYDNTLVGVNITGENLMKYMEWSYNYFNTYKDGDITISFNNSVKAYNYDQFDGAINYTVDLSKPAGERISIVEIDGKPFDASAKYKLALNSYRYGSQALANGWVKKEDKFYDSTNEPIYAIRDMITEFVRENKGVSSTGDYLKTTDNWRIDQMQAGRGIAATRDDDGAGEVLWNKLKNKEVCIHIDPSNVKYPGIGKAVNVNDDTTYYANPAFEADASATGEELNWGCSYKFDPVNPDKVTYMVKGIN